MTPNPDSAPWYLSHPKTPLPKTAWGSAREPLARAAQAHTDGLSGGIGGRLVARGGVGRLGPAAASEGGDAERAEALALGAEDGLDDAAQAARGNDSQAPSSGLMYSTLSTRRPCWKSSDKIRGTP